MIEIVATLLITGCLIIIAVAYCCFHYWCKKPVSENVLPLTNFNRSPAPPFSPHSAVERSPSPLLPPLPALTSIYSPSLPPTTPPTPSDPPTPTTPQDLPPPPPAAAAIARSRGPPPVFDPRPARAAALRCLESREAPKHRSRGSAGFNKVKGLSHAQFAEYLSHLWVWRLLAWSWNLSTCAVGIWD